MGVNWFEKVDTVSDYETEVTKWKHELQGLQEHAAQLNLALNTLREAEVDVFGDLDAARRRAANEAVTRVGTEFQRVLLSLPEAAAERDESTETHGVLNPSMVARRLVDARKELTTSLPTILVDRTKNLGDDITSSLILAEGKSRYQWRLEAYQAAGKALESYFASRDGDSQTLGALTEAVTEIATRLDANTDKSQRLLDKGSERVSGDGSDLNAARIVCENVIGAAAQSWRYEVARELLHVFETDLAWLVQDGAGRGDAVEFTGISVMVDGVSVEVAQSRVLDPAYNGDGAGRLFTTWGWLEKIVQGGDNDVSVLDRKNLEQGLEDRRSRLRDYSVSYIEYWGKTIREHFQVNSDIDWVSFQKILPRLERRSVNSQLAVWADERRAALGVVPSALLSPEQQDVLRTRKGFADAANDLTGERFSDRCYNVIKTWSKLSDDPVKARQVLLNTAIGEFKDSYLVHSSDADRQSSVGFWDSLTDRMLESLADSVLNQYQSGLSELSAVLDKLPLCRDGSSDAAIRDLGSVAASIDKLLGGRQSAPESAYTDGTVGANEDAGIDAVDDLLDDLREAGSELSTDSRQRLVRVRDIAEWLDKKPEVIIWTLSDSMVPSGSKNDRTLLNYASLSGVKQSTGFAQRFPGSFDVHQTTPLVIEYFSGTEVGQSKLGTSTLESPWGLLGLLWRNQVDAKDISDGSAQYKVWVVPLGVDGSSQQIWIGLSFNEPLPFHPREWPGCGEGN